jgi:DNA/RNA endonuclease YhcR with UshA esterase domain
LCHTPAKEELITTIAMIIKSKKIYMVFGIAVLCGLLIGVYLFNKPHVNYGKAQPDYQLNAQVLIDEFSSDESIANSRYLGKVLKVTGSVKGVEKNSNGSISVFLEDEMRGVTCNFEEFLSSEEENRITGLLPGDIITVKGRCDGILTDVRLSKCTF